MAKEQLKWKEIRDLAENINKLYIDKEITDGVEKGSSNKSRETDPHASIYVDDSREIGYVNLMQDVTAPFLAENFGEKPAESEKFYQRFDFGYEDAYEEYIENGLKPALYSQYLVHEDNTTVYTTEDLAKDLKTTNQNVNNLIESKRHEVRKFWDGGEPYFDKEKHSGTGQVSAEIYAIINNLRTQKCNGVVRFAYAGLNANHNGNAAKGPGEGRPMPWYSDDVARENFLEGESSDMSTYTLSLTGVSWENNLRAENEEVEMYQHPPVSCCAEYVWPIIGALAGGEQQDVFPTNLFLANTVIGDYTIGDWCDKRKKYRKLLTDAELKEAGTAGQSSGYFSAGSALFSTDSNSKAEAKKLYGEDEKLDKWVTTDTQSFGKVRCRIKPVKFKVTSTEKSQKTQQTTTVTKYACVNMVMSIVIEISPKSLQPAVRKRWYDMLYYTLRNIAGYKYKDKATEAEKIIGVTWKKDTYFKLVDAFRQSGESDDNACLCDRWKYLKIGNIDDEQEVDNKNHHPFVGTQNDFKRLSTMAKATNAAQMWQIKEEKFPEKLSLDNYFLEPYFEQYICAVNMSSEWTKYHQKGKQGGFKNDDMEASTKPSICLACNDIVLPWDGGDDNKKQSCAKEGGDEFYNTHRFTYTTLNNIYNFISSHKNVESKQVSVKCLQDGLCYAKAQPSETKVTATGMNFASTCEYDKITTTDVTFPWSAYYYTNSDSDLIKQKEDQDTNSISEKILYQSGYNMYAWLEFDPGGDPRKDLEISIMQQTLNGPFDCKMALYKTDTSKSEPQVESVYHASVKLCDGKYKYSLWTYGYSHNEAGWPLCTSEDNDEGQQTVVDIFLAPYVTKTGELSANYLGTYAIVRNSNKDDDITETLEVSQCDYPCGKYGEAHGVSADKLTGQKYSGEYIKTSDSTGGSGMITIVQPSNGQLTLFTRLKIPSSLFAGVGKDEHQKYIVLACRGHEFKLRSNLHASNGVVEAHNEGAETWNSQWGIFVAGCQTAIGNYTRKLDVDFSIKYV